eukprot:COSAG04_NODE_29183_length_270_cov_1.210526_1_plen_28_part_10
MPQLRLPKSWLRSGFGRRAKLSESFEQR